MHLKETLPARTTLVNSVYLRKIVFGIQCFPSLKGNSIDRDGHMGRIKDSQSGHKYGEWTHQQKSCPCSSSPHSMGCILFARRILRMQEIKKTKNQTTSPGDTKVAFLPNDEFNP